MSSIDFTSLNASISELQTQFDSLMSAMKKTSAEFSAIAAQLNRPSFLEPLSPKRPLSAEKQRPLSADALQRPLSADSLQRPPPIDTATPAAAKAAQALQEAIHIDKPILKDIEHALSLVDSLFEYLHPINLLKLRIIIAYIDELIEEAFALQGISGAADRLLIYYSSKVDNMKGSLDSLDEYVSATQPAHQYIRSYNAIHDELKEIQSDMKTYGCEMPRGLDGNWWAQLIRNTADAAAIAQEALVEPSQYTLIQVSILLHKIANATEYIPYYKDVHIQAKFAISLIDSNCIGDNRLTLDDGIYDYIVSVHAHLLKMKNYLMS